MKAMKVQLKLKNGQRLYSNKLRHINVRFFFIKDHLERNEIQITRCKSKGMIADFFTTTI